MLRRLVSPTNTRARIYDRDGALLLDSRNLYGRGDVLRFDLPPPTTESRAVSSAPASRSARWLGARRPAALSRARAGRTARAIRKSRRRSTGYKSSMVRINERGEVIVSVAVPVQRFRAVRGALHALDPRRRHRRHGRGRAARDLQGVPDRRRRDGGAVVPARRHHRRPGAAACRSAPRACAGASARAWRFPISPAGATRSAICPARCAT